jgi:hypothetical protein
LQPHRPHFVISLFFSREKAKTVSDRRQRNISKAVMPRKNSAKLPKRRAAALCQDLAAAFGRAANRPRKEDLEGNSAAADEGREEADRDPLDDNMSDEVGQGDPSCLPTYFCM